MVRLKETSNPAVTPIKGISIPYGAIKSKRTSLLVIYKSAFQFLMVRLKASNLHNQIQVYHYFNSLWCD